MMLSFMSLSLAPTGAPEPAKKKGAKLKDFGQQTKVEPPVKEPTPRWLAKDSCASLRWVLNIEKHALVGVLDPRAAGGDGEECTEHPVVWCVKPGGTTGMFLPPTPEPQPWNTGALLAVGRADGASVFRTAELDGVCARTLGESWRHATFGEGPQWAFIP